MLSFHWQINCYIIHEWIITAFGYVSSIFSLFEVSKVDVLCSTNTFFPITSNFLFGSAYTGVFHSTAITLEDGESHNSDEYSGENALVWKHVDALGLPFWVPFHWCFHDDPCIRTMHLPSSYTYSQCMKTRMYIRAYCVVKCSSILTSKSLVAWW